MHKGFELVGVHDSLQPVAEAVSSQYQCRHFRTFESLINDPQIDLVVVATPTHTHHDLALQAIAAGKQVLVEKPFAQNPSEAMNMFETARRAGVFVGAYHNRRFDPDVLALGKIIKSGVLGPLVKVSINLHAYTRRNDWQTLRANGGGALSNWGAHALDWCHCLFGTGLTLSTARMLQVLNPGDAEDCFFLALESGSTHIEIDYLNCAALDLPKWHVVGQYGSVLSKDKIFHVRYCNPARLTPLETEPGCASDGTYGIQEELGWVEETHPWGHWDNCPPYFDILHRHLRGEGPPPVAEDEVMELIRLMEKVRSFPCHSIVRSGVVRS